MKETKDSTKVSLEGSGPIDEATGIRERQASWLKFRDRDASRKLADDLGSCVLPWERKLEVLLSKSICQTRKIIKHVTSKK